jgi:hypothetical protein
VVVVTALMFEEVPAKEVLAEVVFAAAASDGPSTPPPNAAA